MELQEIARVLEEAAEAHGWDQPATLWAVHGTEVRLHTVLEGHPAAVMIGVRFQEADGCAVVTEGWTHTPERMEQVRAGIELDTPSSYKDAIEVRNCCVVMRDGRELVAQRVRGGGLEVLVGEGTRLAGRVVEAQRRVLGVPSMARCDAGVDQMRERVKLSMLGMLMSGPRSIEDASSEVVGAVLREWLEIMGLFEDDWERARFVALQHALKGGQSAELLSFLGWADGAMWGDRLDQMHLLVEEARERLVKLVGSEDALETLLAELG